MDDASLWERLKDRADREYDGHLTVLKFTTNWRVSLGTPTFDLPEDAIARMPEGQTFAEAAEKALAR